MYEFTSKTKITLYKTSQYVVWTVKKFQQFEHCLIFVKN